MLIASAPRTPARPGSVRLGGAAMRRSTVVAVLGGAVTVAAGAWYGLVERDIVTDKHVAGVALSRRRAAARRWSASCCSSAGCCSPGASGEAEAAYEDFDDEDAEEYVWPTIVVRRHGRPRQRPSARIVTVPPSTWPVPSPRHPSMAGTEAAATLPERRPPAVGEGWLPDNVQRLPFRG